MDKPQTGCAFGAIPGRICPVEALKYKGQGFLRYTWTAVMHGDLHPGLADLQGNLHNTTRRSKADGILDKIVQDLLNPLCIQLYVRRGSRKNEIEIQPIFPRPRS